MTLVGRAKVKVVDNYTPPDDHVPYYDLDVTLQILLALIRNILLVPISCGVAMGSSCTSCADKTSASTNRRPNEPEAVMEAVQPSLHLDDYDIENCPLYIGKFDYESRSNDDLGFKRGDLIYILKVDDDGWWLAHSKESGKSGYIPSSYIVEYGSLDKEL